MENETVLRKKKIAVVSKRREVMDFFRLEGESCFCSVSVMPLLPLDLSEYDMIILDDDGSYKGQIKSGNIYRIIVDDDEQNDKTLSWPVSVHRVRNLFEGYISVSKEATSEAENKTLYLIDGREKSVVYKSRRILLTESEWKVLACLANAKGTAVSRERLRELFEAEEGNITDVYICHLRRKLESPFGEKLIRTVRGNGYALSVDVEFE